MGALELHILLGEFVDVDFKRSRFTMKWNESESEVVYSDPAIDMSQSNHLRRKGWGGEGGVRLSKNQRGDTNRRLKPTQAILTKTIHKTRRQAGGFVLGCFQELPWNGGLDGATALELTC